MLRFTRVKLCVIPAILCSGGAMLALASCAQMAQVKLKRAVLQGPPGPEPLASAEKEIARALRPSIINRFTRWAIAWKRST